MGMTRQPAGGEASAMQADAQRASFGQYLQTTRMQNQIRLEEVAEQTRIRLATLQAIENEDFARLPPEVFTIGFLKAFAQAVGADGSEAVQRYHAHCRLRRQTLRDERPPKSGRAVSGKLIVALAMLAVLIAACLFAYRYWQQGSTTSPPVRASQPTGGEAEAPPAERLAAQPPSEALKPPSPPPAPRHRLLIVAHENSWVKVVIDQGAASEHKLKAGEQLRLEAQTGFNLLIGNVGGVKLSLDNQAVTIPGKRGEVVNIHLP